MAEIVFNDAGKRKQLEGIIHPRVRLLLEERLAAARRAGDCLVLVEVPLLYETNFQRFVDKVIVVRVSEQQQLMRLRQRDGLSLAEAKRRIAAQMPLEEKAALADYVIDNDGTLAETEKQARQILGRLLEECSHARFVKRLFLLLIIAAAVVCLVRSPKFLRLFYPYCYRAVIEANAAEYRVDPLLVLAIIRTESNFKSDAVSAKGALGLMQVMPETAEWIAGQLGMEELSREDILQPEINIKLGTWYLANLREEFPGSIDVVIAAYNGGRGRVRYWPENGIWSGSYADRADIPLLETRQFLYKVRTAYKHYQYLYR